jgi:endogenous inhibitor of DNA gyrase (YacG/DUF329 family)
MEDRTQEELRSDLGRALQSLRQRVPGVCIVCGTPFEGTTKRKFCSHKCAAADSRRRLSRREKQGSSTANGQ